MTNRIHGEDAELGAPVGLYLNHAADGRAVCAGQIAGDIGTCAGHESERGDIHDERLAQTMLGRSALQSACTKTRSVSFLQVFVSQPEQAFLNKKWTAGRPTLCYCRFLRSKRCTTL